MKKKFLMTFSKKILIRLSLALLALIVTIVCIILVLVSSSHQRSTSISGELRKPGEKARLAIIIDDFGSGRDGVKEMMSINKHITFAVMPFLEHSEEDAQNAYEKGYEVIIHMSMEPNYGKRSWLGPRPILAGMNGDEVRKIARDAFDSIPFAAGANIHMGSKASSDEIVISALMDVIKERRLYFVDSRTASHPVAKKIAKEKNVRCYDRDVFLDGQQPKSFIINRLREAGDIALKYGKAVAIGHVGIEGGKVTAEAIGEMLPDFESRNIELVFVSELD